MRERRVGGREGSKTNKQKGNVAVEEESLMYLRADVASGKKLFRYAGMNS